MVEIDCWFKAYLVVSQIAFFAVILALLDFQMTNPMDSFLFARKIFSISWGHFTANSVFTALHIIKKGKKKNEDRISIDRC